MTTEQKKQMAEKAFKAIKAKIAQDKKAEKEYAEKYPQYRMDKRTPMAEMGITMKHGWNGAKDEKYRLTMYDRKGEQVHIIETDSRNELAIIITILFGLLNQQKKVKGWSSLNVVRDKAEFGCGYYTDKVEYPSKITLNDAPCAEFKSLQNYLKKYANYTLPNFYIFHSRMGGKRGVLWDEYGERIYLDNRPKKCADVLANLRKFRGTKDSITCRFGNENWMDEVDRRYSERHEIECDGEKRSYVTITIKTPQGKVKYESKIY